MCVMKEVMPALRERERGRREGGWAQWASDCLTAEKSICLKLDIRAVFNPLIKNAGTLAFLVITELTNRIPDPYCIVLLNIHDEYSLTLWFVPILIIVPC